MQCIAITKGQKRCRKPARLLFCPAHRKHPLVLAFLVLSGLGLFSGLFRDLIEPLLPQAKPDAALPTSPVAAVSEIKVPVEFESTWDSDTTLSQAAQVYLMRPLSPIEDQVVYSAVARVEVPPEGATLNGEIWIPRYRTISTEVTLPRSVHLSRALATGGHELRIVVKNKYGHTFTHSETTLFDEQAIATPVRFWLRFVPEQVP